MTLRVDVQYACARTGVPKKAAILEWARAALEDVATNDIELVVRIVGEDESAELNRRYRHKSGPTNVLSFCYADQANISAAPGLLGDIVICAPVVAREARLGGGDAAAHWAHMVVHGIMHLRGYDHIHERDAKIMEQMESRVVRRLGFADPYA
ncbi:MAG: rRNA maturation RNase YbeY [Gammaproteobacteria bacterium]|nr:rRNA maturation RNase YbeY [Gammaproteobacteria bacterium]